MNVNPRPLSDNMLETLILEASTIEQAIGALQAMLSTAGCSSNTGRHGLVQLIVLTDQLRTIRHDLDELDELISRARDAFLEDGRQAS